MLDAKATGITFWDKIKAFYGVVCVTQVKLPFENDNFDYHHLLLQLLCVFSKTF